MTRLRSRVLTACLSLAVAAGCATNPGAGRPEAGNSRLVLTEADLAPMKTQSIYEAIHKLRGEFFTYRGETSLDATRSKPYPDVYVNGTLYGDLETLRNIPASDVSRVQLLRAWEATTRYGTGHPSGVIEVTTKS